MSGPDSIQMLTFITGAVIILTTVVAYKSPEYDMKLKALVDVLSAGLGFWLVAYTCLVVHDSSRRKDGMYKNLIVILSLTAILVWVFNGNIAGAHDQPEVSGAGGGWKDVALNVARPLALGSMFALPYLWYNRA